MGEWPASPEWGMRPNAIWFSFNGDVDLALVKHAAGGKVVLLENKGNDGFYKRFQNLRSRSRARRSLMKKRSIFINMRAF